MLGPTTVNDARGDAFKSGCIACPDEPCLQFSPDEVDKEARIVSATDLDRSVCPTGAIGRRGDGLVEVDPSSCIGCGLCVVRCPVGAIWIDEEVASARVEQLDFASFDQVELAPEEFLERRRIIAEALQPESAPFKRADIVASQVDWATPLIQRSDGQHILRLLARNTFLIAAAASRLKRVGDNNAICELLVDIDDGPLLLIEVEPSGETLDAMRRALAGCAIAIARQGVGPEELAAALVVSRLPNKRVDYYAVVDDIRSRLGIETYTVPLALALLVIRSGGAASPKRLMAFGPVSDKKALVTIEGQYGSIGDPIRAGIAPPK